MTPEPDRDERESDCDQDREDPADQKVGDYGHGRLALEDLHRGSSGPRFDDEALGSCGALEDLPDARYPRARPALPMCRSRRARLVLAAGAQTDQ